MTKVKVTTSCVLVVFLALLVMGSDSCFNHEEEVDKADRKTVSRQQGQYRRVQPVPYYEYSNELDVYRQIYDARVENVISTHTVIRSNTGVILDDFPSLGFPIPYDVQLTNPLKMVDMGESSVAIEQPEPSGLYSSKTTAATWALRVLKFGETTIVTPVYTEDKVSCYPFPIIVDRANNTITPLPDAVPGLSISTDRLKGLK